MCIGYDSVHGQCSLLKQAFADPAHLFHTIPSVLAEQGSHGHNLCIFSFEGVGGVFEGVRRGRGIEKRYL